MVVYFDRSFSLIVDFCNTATKDGKCKRDYRNVYAAKYESHEPEWSISGMCLEAVLLWSMQLLIFVLHNQGEFLRLFKSSLVLCESTYNILKGAIMEYDMHSLLVLEHDAYSEAWR